MVSNQPVKSAFRIDFRPNDISSRVYQIQDGRNTLTTYHREFGNRGIYESTESGNYPIITQSAIPSLVDYKFVQTLWNGQMVKNIEQSNANLRINMHGFGVHGFGKTITKDNLNNLTSTNTFDLINIHQSAYVNLLTNKEEKIGSTEVVKQEFQYDHSLSGAITASNHHFFIVKQTSSSSIDFINGTIKEESFTHDNNGNILSHQTNLYDGTNSSNKRLYYTEIQEFDNFTAEGYISYPSLYGTKSITKTLNGQPAVIINEIFEYENATGNLTEYIIHSGTSAEIKKQYLYDNYGNITEIKEHPYDLPTRTTTYTYSDNGLFKLSKTNPLGWKTEWTYDMYLQLPISENDANNKTTTMSYDFAGRLTEKTHHNQNTEQWIYEWDTQNMHPDALVSITYNGDLIPEVQTYYDALDRKVLVREKGRGNHWYNASSSYNGIGLLETESILYRDGQASPIVNEYTYDIIGRITKVESPIQEVSYTYPSERVSIETNDKTSVSKERELDPLGNIYKITDAAGTIEYSYSSHLTPIIIKPPVLDETIIEYDNYGRKINIIDPAAGRTSFEYDALNRLTWHRDARGNETEITYDLLNRKISEETQSSIYINTYDNQILGKLDNTIVTGEDDHQVHQHYDQSGNLVRVTEVINNETVEFHYDFNSNDQLISMTYPNGFSLAYGHNSEGLLTSITSPSANMSIWEWVEDDYFGNTSQYHYGNQIVANKIFNQSTGLFESETNPFWGMNYSIDPNSMNVNTRSTTHRNLSESFVYDDLDRLEEHTNSLTNRTINVEYNSIGAIDFKTDAGDYTNNTSSAAVEEIEQIITSKIPEDAQSISYNCFNSVSSLSENGYTARFSYGTHFQRVRMDITDQNRNTITDRYYFGNGIYERDWHNGAWRNLCYVEAPTGDVAVYIEDERTNNGDLFFLYTDYLGSINAIANRDGEILEEFSYDAWGNRRNPRTWEVNYSNTRQPYSYLNSSALWGNFYRGYTGHEHLDAFGLINMNGRLYDPVVGKMLSPDTYVQKPDYSQNFNRYSYCWNNPLKYTDPSGEIVITTKTALLISTLYGLYFTEVGYDVQKQISPVAVKIDIGFGTHTNVIGGRVSYGIPQMLPYSKRYENGAQYFFSNNNLENGWVYTKGEETSYFGVYAKGKTTYSTKSGKHNQTLGTRRYGVPGLNVKLANDYYGDGGDRWRTGGGKLNIGLLSIGVEIMTGDPGLDQNKRNRQKGGDGKLYYEENDYGDDPDNMRQGALYIEYAGILRIGIDSESVRRQVQDKWIHDKRGYPRFKWKDYPNRFYFQFGSSGTGLY